MKYTWIVLPLLASFAWAQEENPYKSLSLGDRVQVMFRSGNTISGRLVLNPVARAPIPERGSQPEEKIDYTKEASLTVDLSWEYPGLSGTMTIAKREIKQVKRLDPYDEKTRQRVLEEKAKSRLSLEEQNLANREDAQQKDAQAEKERQRIQKEKEAAEAKAREEALEAARKEKLKILAQFPPEAGWGADKLSEINGKIQRKQPVTEQERAFKDSFPLWSAAKTMRDEMPKGEK